MAIPKEAQRVIPKEYVFKCVVLGCGGVGKTSMVLRLTENRFTENYIMSIGANFSIKLMRPRDDLIARLQIWDLAGQAHFRFVRPSFYRGAFGALFVFDITNRESFEEITDWVTEAQRFVPGIPFVLVGNKVDLIEERVVSKREGEALAKQIGALAYYESSAKEATNVQNVFEELTNELIELHILHTKSPVSA